MKPISSILLVVLLCLSAVSCKKEDPNCAVTPVTISGNCIDSTLIDPSMMCTEQWEPVCGCDGVTYSNSCHAAVFAGVISFIDGECCDD